MIDDFDKEPEDDREDTEALDLPATVGRDDPFSKKHAIRFIPVASIQEKNIDVHSAAQFDPEHNPKDLELLESVRVNGVVEPVAVEKAIFKPEQPEIYWLLTGRRRLSAARIAGIAEIPALIAVCEQNLPDHLSLLENSGQMPISHFEQMREIMLLREMYPSLSDRDVASLLGSSQGKVSHLTLAWQNSSPILKALLLSQKVEVKAIVIIRPVFAKLSIEEQKLLGKILVDGFSREEAMEMRELVEDGLSPIAAAIWTKHKDGLGNLLLQQDTSEVAAESSPSEEPLLNEAVDLEELSSYLKELAGISQEQVKQVLEQFQGHKTKWLTVVMACLTISYGYERQKAVEIAGRLMSANGNKSTVSLIQKRLKLRIAARNAIQKAAEQVQPFIRCFFGFNQ